MSTSAWTARSASVRMQSYPLRSESHQPNAREAVHEPRSEALADHRTAGGIRPACCGWVYPAGPSWIACEVPRRPRVRFGPDTRRPWIDSYGAAYGILKSIGNAGRRKPARNECESNAKPISPSWWEPLERIRPSFAEH